MTTMRTRPVQDRQPKQPFPSNPGGEMTATKPPMSVLAVGMYPGDAAKAGEEPAAKVTQQLRTLGVTNTGAMFITGPEGLPIPEQHRVLNNVPDVRFIKGSANPVAPLAFSVVTLNRSYDWTILTPTLEPKRAELIADCANRTLLMPGAIEAGDRQSLIDLMKRAELTVFDEDGFFSMFGETWSTKLAAEDLANVYGIKSAVVVREYNTAYALVNGQAIQADLTIDPVKLAKGGVFFVGAMVWKLHHGADLGEAMRIGLAAAAVATDDQPGNLAAIEAYLALGDATLLPIEEAKPWALSGSKSLLLATAVGLAVIAVGIATQMAMG